MVGNNLQSTQGDLIHFASAGSYPYIECSFTSDASELLKAVKTSSPEYLIGN